MHLFILNTDDSNIINVMVFKEFTLEFSWCDLEPLNQIPSLKSMYFIELKKTESRKKGTYLKSLILNQLLNAIRNIKIIMFILKSHIPSFKIPVFGNGVSGRLIVFPVAFEDVWAREPQLTCFTGTEFFAFCGDVFGAHVWEYFSGGADGGVPFVPWLCGNVSRMLVIKNLASI